MDKFRLSLIVIGVLAIGIVLGGWFLAVQPQLDRIGKAATQTSQIRQLNQIQEAKNLALKIDNDNLEQFKADLAQDQAQIPAARSQQDLVNQLDAAAAAAGVVIGSVDWQAPIAYMPPTGVTVTLPSGGTLVSIEMSISVSGTRAQLQAFAANVQNSTRVISVTDSQFTGPEDSTLTLSGDTWVLMPTT